MSKDNPEDDKLDDLEVEVEDERVNDELEVQEKEPLFPFEHAPYQEKSENENDIHDYEMGTYQELDLGESSERMRKRTLGDERGAGHEP